MTQYFEASLKKSGNVCPREDNFVSLSLTRRENGWITEPLPVYRDEHQTSH